MIERAKEKVGYIRDRYILMPAVSAFIGVGAWFSDYIAQDIAESAFKDVSRYGKPRMGQGVTNVFLPPWIRKEVNRAISLGEENFRIRQQAREEVGRILLHDRRN